MTVPIQHWQASGRLVNMPENPYEPPKEMGTGQAKRWLALSVLAALAVPAASIAGSATCLGATYAEQSLDLFGVRYQTLRVWSCVILGVASSFAVLVAVLARPPERRRAALDAAAGMLGAFPIALALSAVLFAIGYGNAATDSLGGT